MVGRASGRPVPVNKAIVGEAIFTHESGIHVSGLLRDPANYQALDPGELGRSHSLVLGKHSGTAAIRWAYDQLGIPVADGQARSLLTLIRAHTAAHKRQPETRDLLRFLDETAAMPHHSCKDSPSACS